MYIDEVDAEKGYGYDFNVEKVYDLREGNNIWEKLFLYFYLYY